MRRPVPSSIGMAGILLAFAAPGCQTGPGGQPTLVEAAWRARREAPTPAADASGPANSANSIGVVSSGAFPHSADELAEGNTALAVVNGRPISREQVVDLLLAGHGVGVLEQIVVLERARSLVAERGLTVREADVQTEYDRALRMLLSPLDSGASPAEFDRPAAERLLDEVLSRRNVSRAEYRAGMLRNAYLRAIVQADMTFSDAQLTEEYQRAFGARVEVRHIQLTSMGEAERLAAQIRDGADFADLARRYSANLLTGPAGGLLRPFSADDPEIPAGLRQAAFRLPEGQVSNPVRADEWLHLVRVERRLPAEERALVDVRPELERRLRERLVEPAMQVLHQALFEQADIRVIDPVLAEEFARKHPRRAASSSPADN